jgi:hypothetical protein
MPRQHVVVDGSNIATEGRSTPSLAQLEDAVRELRRELPDAEITVVVDATFAHRIDPSEVARFEEAALRGEYVYPPAGAIGRGDAFLLRIAERVDAIVLSNDSFQEFHGEHAWLFDRGRLLGATPVPGIGWIFVPRTPVRGPKSRMAVRDANRAKERVEKAIVEATKEAVEPDGAHRSHRSRRSRGRATSAPQAVNDPITFIRFIADHPLGDRLEAEVESFSSHGAVARYGDVRCYVPLANLGNPAPKSAREVLRKGETRLFVVTALDPYRRGVELALPDVAVVSGHPSEETVAAEVRMARTRRAVAGPPPVPTPATPPPGRRPRKAVAERAAQAASEHAPQVARVPSEIAAPSPDEAPKPTKRAARPRKAVAERAAQAASEHAPQVARVPSEIAAPSPDEAPKPTKRAARPRKAAVVKAPDGGAMDGASTEAALPEARRVAAKAASGPRKRGAQ